MKLPEDRLELEARIAGRHTPRGPAPGQHAAAARFAPTVACEA